MDWGLHRAGGAAASVYVGGEQEADKHFGDGYSSLKQHHEIVTQFSVCTTHMNVHL